MLKCLRIYQKSVNQGQSHVVVYPFRSACELQLFTETALVLCASPGWNRDLKSVHSSFNVVIQQQRQGYWLWGSGSRKPWCDGNARCKRIACAVCKGEGALLNPWESHWNGIDKRGGRTQQPPLLCCLYRKRRLGCYRLLAWTWRRLLTEAARIIIAIYF